VKEIYKTTKRGAMIAKTKKTVVKQRTQTVKDSMQTRRLRHGTVATVF